MYQIKQILHEKDILHQTLELVANLQNINQILCNYYYIIAFYNFTSHENIFIIFLCDVKRDFYITQKYFCAIDHDRHLISIMFVEFLLKSYTYNELHFQMRQYILDKQTVAAVYGPSLIVNVFILTCTILDKRSKLISLLQISNSFRCYSENELSNVELMFQ